MITAIVDTNLRVFRRVFGADHYEVAVNLNNLAAHDQAQGNQPKALRLYQSSLAIKQKILGVSHPDVAVTMNNLAVLYTSRRNYETAVLYRQAGKSDREIRHSTIPL